MPLPFLTKRHRAQYHSLGEPGPGIQHVWLCLPGHEQPVAELAAQLANLNTPERLLILPAAPTWPGAAAKEKASGRWFRAGSLGPDLALVRAYLDELLTYVLVQCPRDTPVTVLGYGHGATAAAAWLAGNDVVCERLIFYAAVFPAGIDRPRLLADLPKSPVVVVATAADAFPPEANGAELVQDVRAAGRAARLSYADDGPLTQAVLGIGAEEGGLRAR